MRQRAVIHPSNTHVRIRTPSYLHYSRCERDVRGRMQIVGTTFAIRERADVLSGERKLIIGAGARPGVMRGGAQRAVCKY